MIETNDIIYHKTMTVNMKWKFDKLEKHVVKKL